jgi:hypothetical protein
MQGVRRARATGTRVILRTGVSDDLKVARRRDHEAARGVLARWSSPGLMHT